MRKKSIAILLCLTLVLTLFTGCKKMEVVWESNLGENTLLKIEKETVSVEEAKLIMLSLRNLYIEAMGEELIDSAQNVSDFEDYLRRIVLSELAKTKTMVLLAGEKGVTISVDEKKTANKAANAFFDELTDAEKEYIALDVEDIERLYMDYALSDKLYRTLSGGVSSEVSDDDARVMKVKQIVLSVKANADEITSKLMAGADFTELANRYSEVSSREYLLYRQDMSDLVYAAISSLNDGQYTPCIKEDGKYYFYYVVSKIEREETDENKLVIVKEREKEAVDDVYEEYRAGINSSYNETVLNALTIKDAKGINTAGFFKIFNKYFPK